MTYDAVRHRMVLFGGDAFDGTLLADTWAWDGEAWTQRADIGPSARAGHQLAYDGTRAQVLLFGGRLDEQTLEGDTWAWDGDVWTQLADTGPDARTGHQLAFDATRQRVVLFGGEATGGVLRRDTWEWDGQTWTQRDDMGPPPRRQHSMAWDGARGRLVLFGGDGGAVLADTWEWDGAGWTQVADTGPAACAGAAMTFDGSGVLLFGGIDATGEQPPRLFGVTWEWNGHDWTARQDFGPSPRWGHTLAFDADRSRPVLFGGANAAPKDQAIRDHVLGDTWETSVSPAVVPEPAVLSFVFSPDHPGFPGFHNLQGAAYKTNITVVLDRPAPSALNVGIFDVDRNAHVATVTVPAGAVNAGLTDWEVPTESSTIGTHVFEARHGTSKPQAVLYIGLV